MVTAELALASLALAPVVAALGWVFGVLGLAFQCQGTASEVARQLARGDQAAAARAEAAAPTGAVVRASRSGDEVRVVVTLQARPWVAWLPAVPLELGATMLAEPEERR
ncbi:MAG: TadE family type IV pilus minor pilin [Propionicimonas sp.]|uniref:TadE family type IV pilus minor pilin n=1 Tax=Propionicimonas sp. TaxID=1955623 RepID=UPI002B21458F|nr:TadE family type IV pilus minor pilin [Propionicimonas sp.]MEA4945814.1 TadE family type IV pilus minor pilin [Propionicimonas sp.]MEA5119071.1 TadE family type IV pilus minor pilin [Propionicimonas sp.]